MLASLSPRADILEVISNLSSDEVFTPPPVANAVLDLLPEEVWSDPSLRWLDPGTKTGVFLREAARRLMEGLEGEIPDEDKRREHILNNMLFGAAITELTALMARRSLYCSKDPDGEKSIVRMKSAGGNIFFERVEHSFDQSGKCLDCGGSEKQVGRGPERENYAYAFIHEDGVDKMRKVMDMQFDVIVGNPPYQMDIGQTSDIPLYNSFVETAMDLAPRYLAMVIPSRWMAGGKGLSNFREKMLTDGRIRELVDFPNALDVFPGVEIQSGVCYFLWDRDAPGPCRVTQFRGGEKTGPTERNLDEYDVFVRDENGLAILEKVMPANEASVSAIISGQTPFGLTTNFKGYRKGRKQAGDLKLHLIESQKRTERWVARKAITKNAELIDSWKVLVPMAYNGGTNLPHRIIGPSLVVGPKSVCTQSYLVVGPFESEEEAKSFNSYLSTRFFRFLLSLRKISQHAMRGTYAWVPQQKWNREWTDEALYDRYGITQEEQAYIESMVKEIAE